MDIIMDSVEQIKNAELYNMTLRRAVTECCARASPEFMILNQRLATGSRRAGSGICPDFLIVAFGSSVRR